MANKYLEQLKNGILTQNPTFVQLLGMCPTLATTTSVVNALGMGLATTVVLTFSNLFISLVRKIIPKEVRIASYIVIISGFVTAVELLIKAYLPAIDASLGLFIPLIVVNCIILARAEAFASKNPPLPSLMDGFAMGLGFTCALSLIAAVRELLGTGGLFAAADGTGGVQILGAWFSPVAIFLLPSGAFLTLGFLIALVQKIMGVALGGFTTVMILLLVLGSLIMISLGIIGYYVGNIYEEIKDRPRYIVADTCGGVADRKE